MVTLISPNQAIVTSFEQSNENRLAIHFFEALSSSNSPVRMRANIANNIMDAQTILYFTTINKFRNDLSRKQHLVAGNLNEANNFFNKSLSFISTFSPTNIIVGLTNSRSIYFRFYNSNLFETHLEVFYTKEDEEDDIEGVVTIYKNDEAILKQYGSLNDVFNSIKDTIQNQEVKYLNTLFKETYFEEYALSE